MFRLVAESERWIGVSGRVAARRQRPFDGRPRPPLAFDNAVSEAAARTKNIESRVAGRANILLAPDLEAGNMMAKQLQYLAGADSAGIVLGARVPIALTSRSESVRSRLASTVVMALLADAQRHKRGAAGEAGRPPIIGEQ